MKGWIAMRLSTINETNVIRNFDGKYVDMEVTGALWRTTATKGNHYLVLWIKERGTGKRFDNPVFIFSEKVMSEIIENVGREKYPDQNDPDVSEDDIVGLKFNAKISIGHNKSDNSNNSREFATVNEFKLDSSQDEPVAVVDQTITNFKEFNQNTGSGEIPADYVFPEEEVSSPVVHTENEFEVDPLSKQMEELEAKVSATEEYEAMRMNTTHNQFQNPMQNSTQVPMQNQVQRTNQNSVYNSPVGYTQTTTGFNDFFDESNKNNGGIEND